MKRTIESLTPPENKQVMWLDISGEVKQLKVYINGEWVVANDDTKNNEEIVNKVLEEIDKDFKSYIKKEDADKTYATKTALDKKVDVVAGKGLSTEDFTSAEKTKLAGISERETIPITDKINLTSENVLTLGAKVAKVANNSMNFYIIADSQGKLPSSETRINIPSSITSLVGAEGANVGDIFVVAKLNSLPVYRIIPLNDAKATNSTYAGTNGVMTPWDKMEINKIDIIQGTADSALNRANNALNNLPTFSESNMNNALKTGVYPWCTLGRPEGSTGAYTCITIHSTTKDSNGFDTIEQTAYGREGELGKVYKRIIFISDSEENFGDWIEITGGNISKVIEDNSDDSTFISFIKKSKSALSLKAKDINSSDPELPKLITNIDSASEEFNITCNINKNTHSYSGVFLTNETGESQIPTASVGSYLGSDRFVGFMSNAYYGLVISALDPTTDNSTVNAYVFDIDKMIKQGFITKLE